MKTKLFTAAALFAVLTVNLTGCATSAALSYARGEYRHDQHRRDGSVIPPKPHPAGYALVPVAAIVDVPIMPFVIIATIPVWLGIIPPQI